MFAGRYLCIVYVKLRVKKQNSIDRITIIKRKANFIKFYLKKFLVIEIMKFGFLLTIIILSMEFRFFTLNLT